MSYQELGSCDGAAEPEAALTAQCGVHHYPSEALYAAGCS